MVLNILKLHSCIVIPLPCRTTLKVMSVKAISIVCTCSGGFCGVNSYNLIPFTVHIANWQFI